LNEGTYILPSRSPVASVRAWVIPPQATDIGHIPSLFAILPAGIAFIERPAEEPIAVAVYNPRAPVDGSAADKDGERSPVIAKTYGLSWGDPPSKDATAEVVDGSNRWTAINLGAHIVAGHDFPTTLRLHGGIYNGDCPDVFDAEPLCWSTGNGSNGDAAPEGEYSAERENCDNGEMEILLASNET